MSHPAGSVTVRVPAKINLHLGVGGLRSDGYHDLVTVFHAVGLWDEVVAQAGQPGCGPQVELDVAGYPGAGVPDIPLDDRNLVWQAAVLLAAHAGVACDVRLTIRKRIPVAGGLAGGSADAAAALVACARLWNLAPDPATFAALAGRIGSDAAFPLLGHTAVGTGRGELLTAVPTTSELHWVLAVSGFGLSTAAGYAELDRLRADGTAPAPLGSPDALLAALAAGDVRAVAARLGNDLQVAALSFAPRLADTLAAGRRHGALAGIVSGSGPTCAFLCADAQDAAALAATLTGSGGAVTALPVAGPAAGAQVAGDAVVC